MKHLIASEKNHIVYDTLREYVGCNVYHPVHIDGTELCRMELSQFVEHAILNENNPGAKKVKFFVIDEANLYCPPKPKPLPVGMLRLNDWSRHYGKSFAVIARRPTQLHSDLVELSHRLFIFNLKGVNDVRYLNDVSHGLGDAVASLEPYHFVEVDQWRNYKVRSPVIQMPGGR